MKISEAVNILGAFCGPRDMMSLDRDVMKDQYGFDQADVFVLFGGSILAGGDILAEAIRKKIARYYIIVGGEGHTTETLRQKMHSAFPEIDTEGRTEAAVFDEYLRSQYGLSADDLECESTNCGNNITNLLALLSRKKIECQRIILAQDATMQRRMAAGMKKYRPDMTVINFAVYQAEVREDLSFLSHIPGMWDIDRYMTLLMGEIERLTAYGPEGKNYIAHVDIPDRVKEAFSVIREAYPGMRREADARYAVPLGSGI